MTDGRSFIDLRSDTVTRPSREMREAMMNATVGDHVLGDDPTAAELEALAAELLGQERALFFPSGTMANQAALLVQAEAGTEVWTDRGAHILAYEEAAAAAIAGVQIRTLAGVGPPSVDAFRDAVTPNSPFLPRASMVCLENTHNSAGGQILPVEAMGEIVQWARERGLRIHLDGARLPNAAIAAGQELRAWASLADTVMVSLSKGLGAPVGSVLAGSDETMERAWRARRRLGGGMRQAGILAAAGLYALRNNFGRLEEDHRRAREIARAAGALSGISAREVETNIVLLELEPPLEPDAFCAGLRRNGVAATVFGPRVIRLVTHLDIDDAGVERTGSALIRTVDEQRATALSGLRAGGVSS